MTVLFVRKTKMAVTMKSTRATVGMPRYAAKRRETKMIKAERETIFKTV